MAKKPARLDYLDSVVHRNITVPMYDVTIHTVFAENAKAGAVWLAEKFPEEDIDPAEYEHTTAFVLCIEDRPWIVLPWDADENTVAHESVHAGFEFNNVIGVTSSYKHQESLAYLVGWLAETLGMMLGDLNLERAKFAAEVSKKEAEIRAAISSVSAPKTGPKTKRPKRVPVSAQAEAQAQGVAV